MFPVDPTMFQVMMITTLMASFSTSEITRLAGQLRRRQSPTNRLSSESPKALATLSQGGRRLAAIMFTDIVGYTALTQSNESQAIKMLEKHNQLLRQFFSKFHGREVKTLGDSFLVEFESALDALQCAVEIQSYLHKCNASSEDEWKINVRIGIHLGDVIRKANDILGDAVNIASRIEPIADPEGICVSDQVFGQVRNKVPQTLVRLGPRDLKNVRFPVDVYKVVMPWEAAPSAGGLYGQALSQRIAILPFANMSQDPEDEYFADGMTEEVISTLSKVKDFEVISRTSVMQYKRTPKPIKEVSMELNAGTILEGSVRKADNKLRITVQMIDATRDRHLWAQSYDKSLGDLFEVQSDVAKQVADALRIEILSPEMARIHRKPTENTTAYTLYLKGMFLWNRRGLDDVKKAVNLFEQATREDPNFASSYVGLADCFRILHAHWGIDLDPNHENSRAMLDKAMELDPTLAEAQAAMGRLLEDDYRLREAEERYRKSIELKPSYAFAHMWYYILLICQLRWDEALGHLEKALELDPLSPIINFNHAHYYFAKGDYDRALELCKRIIELDPGNGDTYWMMALTHARMNRFDEMRRNFEESISLYQGSFPLVRKASEALTALLRDEREIVKRLLPELEAHLEKTLFQSCDVACFYFYLGEIDKGFEWLERSYSKKEWHLLAIRIPTWRRGWSDQVPRSDPRYIDLLKRLELDQIGVK